MMGKRQVTLKSLWTARAGPLAQSFAVPRPKKSRSQCTQKKPHASARRRNKSSRLIESEAEDEEDDTGEEEDDADTGEEEDDADTGEEEAALRAVSASVGGCGRK